MSLSMDSKAIEEAATRWFVRRESGTWTDAEQAQLDAWLDASTAHRIAFIRLHAAWEQAARMKALGAGVPPGVIPPRGSWRDAPSFRQWSKQTGSEDAGVPKPDNSSSIPHIGTVARRYWPIAAAVLLSLAIGIYGYDTGFLRGDRYSTEVGDLDTVPLADGSQVILNTDSRIRVALTEAERRIELDKGEAFFEVAKDATRPFVVLASDKRVVAVGTKFSVRRDAGDVQVIVTEGHVRLERSGAGSAQPPTQLVAGAVAQTAKTSVLVREYPVPEIEQFLSWRSGYVTFRDTTLADAVMEFNRYNTRKIVIADPSIAAIRIGGNFRSDNEDAFLWLLKNGFPIEVEESEEKVVLRSP